MKTISVVDDEIDLLELAKQKLANKYNILTFNNPLFINDDIIIKTDLFILDYAMLPKNGLVLAVEIRNVKKTVPIVMISGFIELINVGQSIIIAPDIILEKPLNWDKLENSIEYLLEEHIILNNIQDNLYD